MANALVHAIGAQAVFPNRQVVSLSDDGGFTIMMGEFVTLLQHDLPVNVLNNGTFGFVELETTARGFLDTNVALTNPDFAALARAMGIKGLRVERPQDLKAALAEAFQRPGPALVDVVSARQDLSCPGDDTR